MRRYSEREIDRETSSGGSVGAIPMITPDSINHTTISGAGAIPRVTPDSINHTTISGAGSGSASKLIQSNLVTAIRQFGALGALRLILLGDACAGIEEITNKQETTRRNDIFKLLNHLLSFNFFKR